MNNQERFRQLMIATHGRTRTNYPLTKDFVHNKSLSSDQILDMVTTLIMNHDHDEWAEERNDIEKAKKIVFLTAVENFMISLSGSIERWNGNNTDEVLDQEYSRVNNLLGFAQTLRKLASDAKDSQATQEPQFPK